MQEFHTHPSNPNEVVYGHRLYKGDIGKPGDVYDSASGIWKKDPIPGLPIINDYFYWVRPAQQEK